MKMKIYLGAFFAILLCSNQVLARCGAPQPNNSSFDHERERFFCVEDWVFDFTGTEINLDIARDSVPQSAPISPYHLYKNNYRERKDGKVFPFFPPSKQVNQYSAAVDLMVHLPSIGTLNGYTIYKVTDGLGVILSGGAPGSLTSPINLPRGQKAKVAPPDSRPYVASADSMGASLRMIPVLLSPVSKITMTEKIKVATFYIRDRAKKFRGKTHFNVYIYGVTLNSTLRTCSLTSSRDVTLKFPTVSKTSFPKVGSLVYGATTDISLNCQHGIEVWATLSDVNNPANRTNTLSIESGTGKAQNVGIQLFKNNDKKPLSYGAQSSVKGNENSWKLSSNRGDRNPSVKLTGYYVHTGVTPGDITPGDVNAQAVITFSYQ